MNWKEREKKKGRKIVGKMIFSEGEKKRLMVQMK